MDNLFTDDNPQTTLKGLGFKNAQIAESSIQRVEQYFDKRLKYQKIPGYPISLKPHILLNNSQEAINFYRNQKMTRILSLANRAKVVIKQTRDPAKIINLQEAYNKLIKWISANKQGGDIYLNKYNKYFNRYKSLGGEDTNNQFNDQEYQRLKKIAKDRGIYAPKKYFSGLNYEESLARLDRMERGRKSDHSDPKSYSEFPTDFKNGKKIQTKLSKYTQQWRKYFPGVTSMEEKSKLTGVPIEILDQVFRSGCAAWRTGHRPGAVEAQWGHARVNSFLVKGKTFYTADKYLVDKIMTSDDKSYKKAQEWFRWVDGLCDERDGFTNPEFCQKSNLLNLYKK